jgi:hypothetical protein
MVCSSPVRSASPASGKQLGRGFPAGTIRGAFADQVATRYPEDGFGGPVDEHEAPIARVFHRNDTGMFSMILSRKFWVRPSFAADASSASS